MIMKERPVPLYLSKLEVLMRRLPKSHPKFQQIQEEYAKTAKGHRGEQALDYYLTFLNDSDYLILHSIRLPNPHQYHFQLDTLVLSPYFILNLESKNISGTLFFDQEFHQLIRIIDDKEEALSDPILQIERQVIQLKQWLHQNKIPQIPVISKVVISHPSTIIKTQPQHEKALKEIVIHAGLLPSEMEKLQRKHSVEKIPNKELKKVARQLIKANTPYNPDILEKFQLKKTDILKGVHCPKCNSLPMIRMKGIWYCASCKTASKDAHIVSLRDYVLLFGNKINNPELREFLQIRSISISNKLLNSINCRKVGERKGRYYELLDIKE